MTPYVFVIDIDGTLIGDISPQVMMYDIVQEVKRLKQNIASFDSNDLLQKLKLGIIRPHFLEFVESVKKLYQAELFIYTASQTKWALFLVKIIEKALGITFNRPIFTRKDCVTINNEFKKSLKNISGRICTCLRKKYEGLKVKDLDGKILMIDNNPVLVEKEEDCLVLCPTYNFRYPENIPARLRTDIFEKNHKFIHDTMSKYINNMPLTSNFIRFQKYYYQMYIDEISEMKNKQNDTFWLRLRDVLVKKSFPVFDRKTVAYINKAERMSRQH